MQSELEEPAAALFSEARNFHAEKSEIRPASQTWHPMGEFSGARSTLHWKMHRPKLKPPAEMTP